VPDRDRNEYGRAENQRPRDRTGRPLPYDTTETALAEDFEYDTADEALATGVALWDQHRFFEAHECLEDVWHHAGEDDREFFKGVIQVAVGCVHHQRGNATGAATLWRRAAGRLDAYPDTHHGIDAARLVAFCRRSAAAVEHAGHAVPTAYPAFPAVDDGPWLDPDRVTPLEREPPWMAAAADRTEDPDLDPDVDPGGPGTDPPPPPTDPRTEEA
jgi:uncharacterized protein